VLASVVPANPLASVEGPSNGSNVALSCPDTFTLYDEYCYYFSTKDEPVQNWIQAQLHCRAMDPRATLVRPHTQAIDSYITGELEAIAVREGVKPDYWMDLNIILLYSGKYSDLKYGYTNGDITGYTNWAPGEPNGRDVQHCVFYDGTYGWKWVTYQCGDPNRYICQTPAY